MNYLEVDDLTEIEKENLKKEWDVIPNYLEVDENELYYYLSRCGSGFSPYQRTSLGPRDYTVTSALQIDRSYHDGKIYESFYSPEAFWNHQEDRLEINYPWGSKPVEMFSSDIKDRYSDDPVAMEQLEDVKRFTFEEVKAMFANSTGFYRCPSN